MPRKPQTFDVDEIFWGYDPAAPDTDTSDTPTVGPGGGFELSDAKRIAGWILNENPPFKFFNWFFHRVARTVQWLAGATVERFDNLADALGGDVDPIIDPNTYLDDGDVFRVGQATGADATYGRLIGQNAQGSGTIFQGAADVRDVGTDGAIIVVCYDTFVEAYSLSDLVTPLWTYDDPNGKQAQHVSVDGRFVIAGYAFAAGDEVFRFDRITGAILEGADFATDCVDIDSNSEYVILGLFGDTSARIFEETDFTSIVSVLHGAAINSVAVARVDRMIVAGARNGSTQDVTVWNEAGGFIYGFGLALTAGVPTINAVVTDGQFMYLIGDTITDGAETFNIWVYNVDSGVFAWRALWSGVTPTALAVDDTQLHICSSADTLRVYDKRTGVVVASPVTSTYGGNARSMCCNGMKFFGGGGDELRVWRNGVPTKLFTKVAALDATRRPFFNLAVPVSPDGY